MTKESDAHPRPVRNRPPFECIALVLQGGGALGAYQAGVYQAIDEAGLDPGWISGISIGAFNSAIIAGNPRGSRVEKLREFWESITQPYVEWYPPAAWLAEVKAAASAPPQPSHFWSFASNLMPTLNFDTSRGWLNQWAAGRVLWNGTPGFFELRPVTPWFWPGTSVRATSYYDTSALKGTLERLVDFDLINNGPMRLSVGAVNVRTGNFAFFDTSNDRIRPEHIMASGALPPAFAAVEVDGEHYWDGGLVSNTPLFWVVDNNPHLNTLVFHVDLWPSRGDLPRNMASVNTRQKEIMYSSRTRAAATRFRELQTLRNSLADLLQKLPPELAHEPELAVLRPLAERKVWNLIHLIYHAKGYEGDSKDYEFSRESMVDHWHAGYEDTANTLAHPEVLERPSSPEGFFIFDIAERRTNGGSADKAHGWSKPRGRHESR